IHADGTRLLRCSPGYACIAEHRQRGASTPLVLTLFRKRWSSAALFNSHTRRSLSAGLIRR
ncbi:MAG: hypothetical protein V3T83_08855, partial [Acidobacteriota bacterium]